MKNFINYLKGLSVLFYYALPLLFYIGAGAGFYKSVTSIDMISLYWLIYSLVSLIVAVVLTFTVGYKHFDVTFTTKTSQKTAAANEGNKRF